MFTKHSKCSTHTLSHFILITYLQRIYYPFLIIKKPRVIVVELGLEPRESDSRACMLNHSLDCLLGVKTGRKHLCVWRICSPSIPPEISNFILGSSKNTSNLYSLQFDIEGHYNLTLKDKTNLTQRCCWRHPSTTLTQYPSHQDS